MEDEMKRRYAVVYEKTGTGYSAYVPDLPGCIATGHSLEQAKERMRGAIEFHLASMLRDGDPIPEPSTETEVVEAELKKAS